MGGNHLDLSKSISAFAKILGPEHLNYEQRAMIIDEMIKVSRASRSMEGLGQLAPPTGST
jgi:hypothetical protein